MQLPTSALPALINKAKGLNDFVDPVKLEEGYAPFALNYTASGDTWDRREGRDEYWLSDGNPVSCLDVLTWADGRTTYIGQLGSTFYDITPYFSYLFKGNARIIFQAPGGQYWDCTPGTTTGLIFPTVVSTPSATPRTSSLTIKPSETIAFSVDGGSIQLLSDFQNNGWYLQSYLDTLGFTQFTSDVVFTYASGYSLIIQDNAPTPNNWKFSVDNDGTFKVTIV